MQPALCSSRRPWRCPRPGAPGSTAVRGAVHAGEHRGGAGQEHPGDHDRVADPAVAGDVVFVDADRRHPVGVAPLRQFQRRREQGALPAGIAAREAKLNRSTARAMATDAASPAAPSEAAHRLSRFGLARLVGHRIVGDTATVARCRTTGVSTALQWLGVWAAATLLLTLAGLLNRAAWVLAALCCAAAFLVCAPGGPGWPGSTGAGMPRLDALYRASGQAAVDAMGGVEFEHYVAAVLRGRGYTIEFTRATGDFGVDLIATRDGVRTAVQCKAGRPRRQRCRHPAGGGQRRRARLQHNHGGVEPPLHPRGRTTGRGARLRARRPHPGWPGWPAPDASGPVPVRCSGTRTRPGTDRGTAAAAAPPRRRSRPTSARS